MQAFVARRGAFAAAILTISSIAATSGHAAADDAGLDSGAGADAGLDASQDAAAVVTADATVSDDGGAGDDAATNDDFDLYALTDAGPVQDDGSLPLYSGGNVFQALCVADPTVADPTTKPFSFTSVAAPYTDVTGCLAYNDEGHAAAHACFCNKCFTLVQQCDALEGCREASKCGLDHNCTDPTTCYFSSCTTVIDKWANTSAATFLSSKLEGCGCPTQ
jgi:hypothetical protein